MKSKINKVNKVVNLNWRSISILAIIAMMLITTIISISGVSAASLKNVPATLQMPTSMVPGQEAEVVITIKVPNLSVVKYSLVSSDASVIQVVTNGSVMQEGDGSIVTKAKIKALKSGKATIAVKNDVAGGVSQSIDMITMDRIDFAAAVPVVVAPKEQEVKPDVPVEQEKNPDNKKPVAPVAPVTPKETEKEVVEVDPILSESFLSKIEIKDSKGVIIQSVQPTEAVTSCEFELSPEIKNVTITATALNEDITLESSEYNVILRGDSQEVVFKAKYKDVVKEYSVSLTSGEIESVSKKYNGEEFFINSRNLIYPDVDTNVDKHGFGYYLLPGGEKLQVLEDKSGKSSLFLLSDDGNELETKVQPFIGPDGVYLAVDIDSSKAIKKEPVKVKSSSRIDYKSMYLEILGEGLDDKDSILNHDYSELFEYQLYEEDVVVLAFKLTSNMKGASFFVLDEVEMTLTPIDLEVVGDNDVIFSVMKILAIVSLSGVLIGSIFVAAVKVKEKVADNKERKGVDNRIMVGLEAVVESKETPYLDNPVDSDDLTDDDFEDLLQANPFPNRELLDREKTKVFDAIKEKGSEDGGPESELNDKKDKEVKEVVESKDESPKDEEETPQRVFEKKKDVAVSPLEIKRDDFNTDTKDKSYKKIFKIDTEE